MIHLTGRLEKEAREWMEEAAKIANKALCLNAKCGAVIVKDRRV